MNRIPADIPVRPDGFVTGHGPGDPGPDNRLVTDREALHNSAFTDDPDDRRADAAPRVRRTDAAPRVRRAAHRTTPFTGRAPRRPMQPRVISVSTATHLTYDRFR